MARHVYDPSADGRCLVSLVSDHGPGALVRVTLRESAEEHIAAVGEYLEFSGTVLGLHDGRDGNPRFRVWCPMWRTLVALYPGQVSSVLVSASRDRDQDDRLVAALAAVAGQATREWERVDHLTRRSHTTDDATRRAQAEAAFQSAQAELREAIDESRQRRAPSRKG